MPIKDKEKYLEYQRQYSLEKRGRERRKSARQPKEVPCACGCGTLILDWDLSHRREIRFAKGHSNRPKGGQGRPVVHPKVDIECECGCGEVFTSRWNYRKEEYTRFIRGHNIKNIPKEQHPKFGKESWNSQGLTDEDELVRKSPEYKDWRWAVLTRDNFTCQKCGKRGGKLEAHHIKHFATNPDLRIELTNGMTLCRPCHLEEHYG